MLYIHICFIRLINHNLNRELWIIYDLLNLIDDLTRISARFLTKTCLLFLLNLLFNFLLLLLWILLSLTVVKLKYATRFNCFVVIALI